MVSALVHIARSEFMVFQAIRQLYACATILLLYLVECSLWNEHLCIFEIDAFQRPTTFLCSISSISTVLDVGLWVSFWKSNRQLQDGDQQVAELKQLMHHWRLSLLDDTRLHGDHGDRFHGLNAHHQYHFSATGFNLNGWWKHKIQSYSFQCRYGIQLDINTQQRCLYLARHITSFTIVLVRQRLGCLWREDGPSWDSYAIPP